MTPAGLSRKHIFMRAKNCRIHPLTLRQKRSTKYCDVEEGDRRIAGVIESGFDSMVVGNEVQNICDGRNMGD